jgi:alkanesulfonate monooxygenase SsuD/methylene tetrahydromethanopterin reductase-like flavin-dependent oxidoreductase (luciferase family)
MLSLVGPGRMVAGGSGAGTSLRQHDKPGGPNVGLVDELGLRDYLAERFAIAGTPADCIDKIERVAAAGATNLWISVHFEDKVSFIQRWAAVVMPTFR